MKLYEEYFKRHNIVGVPIVRHCPQGAVLLRTNDSNRWKSRWLLVSFRWQDDNTHPGKYEIDFFTPIHDGYVKGSAFAKWPTTYKHWDEYEDFFLKWIADLRGVSPVRGEEAIISAWEMFVHVYDSWFRRQSDELKEKLFESLYKQRTLKSRYMSYQEVLIYLSTHHPGILRVWKYEFCAPLQHYSNWLVSLIEDKCSTLLLP